MTVRPREFRCVPLVRAGLCNLSDWPLTYIEGLRDVLVVGSVSIDQIPGIGDARNDREVSAIMLKRQDLPRCPEAKPGIGQLLGGD